MLPAHSSSLGKLRASFIAASFVYDLLDLCPMLDAHSSSLGKLRASRRLTFPPRHDEMLADEQIVGVTNFCLCNFALAGDVYVEVGSRD